MRPITARVAAAGRSAWTTIGRAVAGLARRLSGEASRDQPGWRDCFVAEVLERYGFTPEASTWLRREIPVQVDDAKGQGGGGFWIPEQRLVRLFTAQHEAAVHELAHAWWHFRRRGQEQALMSAVKRAAHEPDPRFRRVRDLAHGYVFGIPATGWPGLMVDGNDWEMFAGLASGTMGDMRLMPPYLRVFYRGLFRLPDENPTTRPGEQLRKA